MEIIIYFVMKI